MMRGRQIWFTFALCALLSLNLAFIWNMWNIHYVGTCLAPTIINNTIINLQCGSQEIANKRPPTLVIYVYAEVDELKQRNFEFFLQHGLCENCTNIDFAIIINGPTTIQVPNHYNLYVLNRENNCGDFGGWEQLFREMNTTTYKKYKRFMFINDTVRGPFIAPHYPLVFTMDFHFTDIFGVYLTNDTRMVGSYINCGDIWGGDVGFSHVQTMSFMIDDVALEMVRPLIQCYPDKVEAVEKGEIGMSQKLISENINIASLLYAYRGVDFRTNEDMRHHCNNGRDSSYDGVYFGTTVNPMEVVFFKNTRLNNLQLLDMYSNWATNKAHPV